MSLDKVDVICLGQAVVDCITRGAKEVQGQSLALRAESIRLSTGGDAVNESFVLAGMGYKVDLACGLGSDLAGDILLREAKRQGVGVSRIVFPPGLDTPIANLMVSEDGSRRSVNSKATMLEGYIPDPSCVKGARIVSLASLFRILSVRHMMTVLSSVRIQSFPHSVSCRSGIWKKYCLLSTISSQMKRKLPIIQGNPISPKLPMYFTDTGSKTSLSKQGRRDVISALFIRMGCFLKRSRSKPWIPQAPEIILWPVS